MRKRESGLQPSSRTIVFADNDNFVREAIGELLSSEGYKVHLARDGLEALQMIREEKPSYAILDIVMPKLDGSRVCWLIRQDPTLRDTPIIAFSSMSAQAFRDFPELSADAYVAKAPLPLAFQNILKAIEYVDSRSHDDLSAGLFGYDVIRPRQLVDELLQQRKHYTNIICGLGVGVLELDTGGRILMASPGACEILGQSEGRILGEALASFCLGPDRNVVEDLLGELVRASSPVQCRIVVSFRQTGIPLRVCAIVEDEECTGVIVIMESIEKREGTPGVTDAGDGVKT